MNESELKCTVSISQPDLIRIIDRDPGDATYGCDQDWYNDYWQRQAGCGPCTAATVLYYLSRSQAGLDHLYTANSHAKSDFVHFMTEIWHYVTPGQMGVNEAAILADGVAAYAAKAAVRLTPAILNIPGRQRHQPAAESFYDFVRQGLEQDCPVAFLNLSNGRLPNLDSWHWVTITGLLSDSSPAIYAIIADSGERKIIDLALWYQTTWLGGAAVWFKVG